MRLTRCFNFLKKKGDKQIPYRLIELEEVDSTNRYLHDYRPVEGENMTVVVTRNQTAGKGCGENTWESEARKNLLLSILVHPTMVPVAKQFMLSMAGALSIKDVLEQYTEDITLKWPNDVYWKDKKICGTLIETSLGGGRIKNCIFGIGLNVNQQELKSDAPNPVSLCQIVEHELDLDKLLRQLLDSFCKYYQMIETGQYDAISGLYHLALYRAHGFYRFRDADGEFEGAIIEVEDTGRLIMRDREGMIREYMFKEVEFII
jgi:BirA family biotin operon repressor/biotin-[acetyl-CoA-carboxylase] ligase